jgi:putative ABC transport system permease protein
LAGRADLAIDPDQRRDLGGAAVEDGTHAGDRGGADDRAANVAGVGAKIHFPTPTLVLGCRFGGRDDADRGGDCFESQQATISRAITIISIWASSWLVTAFALFAVLQGIEKWYQPQYLIPLLGMVLGNTLNGISVGLNTFTEALVTRRTEVETRLALGATRFEAAAAPLRDAVRTGMIPIVNSMMIVGLVSLPGMMTGQMIAGMNPVSAVKYQIVIIFLIAGATALGTIGVVYLSYRRLFNARHQFRRELIE